MQVILALNAALGEATRNNNERILCTIQVTHTCFSGDFQKLSTMIRSSTGRFQSIVVNLAKQIRSNRGKSPIELES